MICSWMAEIIPYLAVWLTLFKRKGFHCLDFGLPKAFLPGIPSGPNRVPLPPLKIWKTMLRQVLPAYIT